VWVCVCEILKKNKWTGRSILIWLFWRRGLVNYLPRILPISASQEVRIVGMSHPPCLGQFSFCCFLSRNCLILRLLWEDVARNGVKCTYHDGMGTKLPYFLFNAFQTSFHDSVCRRIVLYDKYPLFTVYNYAYQVNLCIWTFIWNILHIWNAYLNTKGSQRKNYLLLLGNDTSLFKNLSYYLWYLCGRMWQVN
jgi:hypothetical protein